MKCVANWSCKTHVTLFFVAQLEEICCRKLWSIQLFLHLKFFVQLVEVFVTGPLTGTRRKDFINVMYSSCDTCLLLSSKYRSCSGPYHLEALVSDKILFPSTGTHKIDLILLCPKAPASFAFNEVFTYPSSRLCCLLTGDDKMQLTSCQIRFVSIGNVFPFCSKWKYFWVLSKRYDNIQLK